MDNLSILGEYSDYKYVLYTEETEKLSAEYKRMFLILKESGFTLVSHWVLDGGILLENDKDVIAGIFFNTRNFNNSLLIHIAYVDPAHRNKGIYRTLHSHIDRFSKSLNKLEIYSYIHLSNRPMVEHIGEKVGYVPVMQLVKKTLGDL